MNRTTQHHNIVLLVVLCLAIVAFALAGEQARELFQYRADMFAVGQYWRLLTAHLVHLGWAHTTLNLLALVLVWVLAARQFHWRNIIGIMLCCAVGISAGLWVFSSDVYWYVGLSGVLHGLLGATAVRMLIRRDWLGGAILVLMTAKILLEQTGIGVTGTQHMISGSVIVDAHLYGALIGATYAAVTILWDRRVAHV